MHKHTVIILSLFLLALGFVAPVKAVTYLTDWDYQIIEKNYPYYQWASLMVGVPVEALIALHYREAALHKGYYSPKRRALIKNLGGPFMLDCGAEGTPEFKERIRCHERKIAKMYGYKGDTRVSHNFKFACLVAANEFKGKARYGMDTERGIADAFWGYNGRAYGSYLNSAYVSSDPKRGRILEYVVRDRVFVDSNPGCFVVFKELKRSEKLKEIASKNEYRYSVMIQDNKEGL